VEILAVRTDASHLGRQFRAMGTVLEVQRDGHAWGLEALNRIASGQLVLLKVPGERPADWPLLAQKRIRRFQHPRSGSDYVEYKELQLDFSIILPLANRESAGIYAATRAVLETTDAVPERCLVGPERGAPAFMRRQG
jgi:hypothetical protein